MVEVVHLINGLGRGGGERLLVRLLKRSRDDKCAAVVYTLTRGGPLVREIEELGVPVRRLTLCGLPLPWVWGRLMVALGRSQVLHTHFFYSDLVGAILGRLLRLPRRISTRHETGYWMGLPHRLLERWVYRGFHEVLCVSEAVRAAMIMRGVEAANLRVLSPGIEVQESLPSRAIQTPPYLVTVGRLERVKGHDLLVRAMARLGKDPDLRSLRLRIVGAGAEEPCLRRLIHDLGLQTQCELVGEVPPTRVAEVVAGAVLFVLPSRSEAAPLSLLEAMGRGVPCIATRVGGVAEIVTDGVDGCLVEAEDHEALATAIRALVLDAGRAQQIGEGAARTVRARFDINRYVQRVHEHYYGEK